MKTLRFLGWSKPLPELAAPLLLNTGYRYGNGPSVDLSDLLVLIPGRQALRSLTETMADLLAPLSGGLFPPEFHTPERFLLEGGDLGGTATPIEQLRAWKQVLSECSRQEFSTLFPVDFPRNNETAVNHLATQFRMLKRELSAGALTMASISRSGATLDTERWEQIAELECRYTELLASVNRTDPEDLKISLAESVEPFRRFEKLIVLAMPDLSTLLLKRLAKIAERMDVELWINAPQEYESMFDGWGRPLPDQWAAYPLDFGTASDDPDADDITKHIFKTETPEQLAVTASALLSGTTSPELAHKTIAITDETLFEPLRKELSKLKIKGTAGRTLIVTSPSGEAMRKLRLYDPLSRLRGFMSSDDFSELHELLRQEDFLAAVEKRLGIPREQLLENLDEFLRVAKERDVEATVLGEFTDDGKFCILYGDRVVACLDISFMHDGLPRLHLKAVWEPKHFEEPDLTGRSVKADVLSMLGRLNICSCEYKARQYDHEVKGLSVIKPYTGVKNDVASDATVFMIEPLSTEGVVLSAGIMPRYSDIDTYHMMASTMDVAIRQAVAVGADPSHLAGLDNFCWPDPVQSEKTPDGEYKLAQLVRANQALYDYAIAFTVPCVSGKDSMKNDSTRGGRKISIPPTVLFSVMGKINDISKAVSIDAKLAGDAVCVIGATKRELGGSEYFAMLGKIGTDVPKVDAAMANKTYEAYHKALNAGLIHSAISPAIGGLAIAAARSAMGGRLGMSIDLASVPADAPMSDLELLFSESNSRFLITCAKADVPKLKEIFSGVPFAEVGATDESGKLSFRSASGVVEIPVEEMVATYKSTLAGV